MADQYINPFLDIVRTDEEIEAVISKSFSTNYFGMTYEEGLRKMYEWLIGETDDPPVDLN